MKIKFTITGEIEVDKGWYDKGMPDEEIKKTEEQNNILPAVTDFIEGVIPDSVNITTTISQ